MSSILANQGQACSHHPAAAITAAMSKRKMVQRFHLLVLCPAQNVQVPPEFDFRDHTVWSCRDGTAVVMAISEAITAT
jgi:hypothetical protein